LLQIGIFGDAVRIGIGKIHIGAKFHLVPNHIVENGVCVG